MSVRQMHKQLETMGDATGISRVSVFENDVAKTNMAAILEQYGFGSVRNLQGTYA